MLHGNKTKLQAASKLNLETFLLYLFLSISHVALVVMKIMLKNLQILTFKNSKPPCRQSFQDK